MLESGEADVAEILSTEPKRKTDIHALHIERVFDGEICDILNFIDPERQNVSIEEKGSVKDSKPDFQDFC